MSTQFKQKYIIIEGIRSSEKTTITNWLREVIAYSQLFRLSGTINKSVTYILFFYKTK